MSGLQRFTEAQKKDFDTALSEIRSGHKRSHWMWYIFPQIHGLGFSSTSAYYAIQSMAEAKDFLNDPYLGATSERSVKHCLNWIRMILIKYLAVRIT